MEAPPVQYTKTSDGYSIAYMTTGSGPALVVLPQLFQHSQRLWVGGGFARTFHYWTQRYRVIQYDSRGQGMSQRGLPDDHSAEGYDRDLEAVIAATGPKSVALYGLNYFGHTAVRFAARHLDRVSALILQNVNVRGPVESAIAKEMAQVARSNWDLYLMLTARSVFPRSDSEAMVSYFRSAANQADQLRLLEVMRTTDIENSALLVQAPTLIVTSTAVAESPINEDRGQLLAPLIPKSRLIIQNDPQVRQGETTAVARAVEAFLDEIGFAAGGVAKSALPDGLSEREVEVLRLIAAGKSNPQIADELVLSINTVQRHVSNILAKTRLANRVEAASYATRHGLD